LLGAERRAGGVITSVAKEKVPSASRVSALDRLVTLLSSPLSRIREVAEAFAAGTDRETKKGKDDMTLYEHVFLARQDLSPQQIDALVEQYKGVITANGGSVGRVEPWGLKSLTYRVNKNRKAYYTLMDITAPAAAVKEMERQMGLSEDVLRFMTIKVEAHEEGPSAMMQKRDRDDRGERGDRPFGDRDRGPRSFGDRSGAPRRPREGFEGGQA
jgi:small subunit ribosomal protein S6